MAMITDTQLNEVWEERWHPFREEWVIVAAHRQGRPWSGETVKHEAQPLPQHVKDCYLCPGNDRIGGGGKPPYDRVFFFDNDHPSVGMNSPLKLEHPPGIFRNQPAQGISRVVCYTPRHDLSLAQLEIVEIENLLAAWQSEYVELGRRPEID